MPYDLDNPPDRIKGLPKHAQEIWIKAYNNALKQYDGDEEKANATAWAQVKKSGYEKNDKGEWVKHSDDFKDWKFDPDRIEVFRAGKYPQGEFSVNDIDEIITNFNPKKYEPPVTKDHEQMGPAYGWTKRIWREGRRLYAQLYSITKDFMEELKEGKWRRISVEIWRDYEESGKQVLKAVSFLGAGAPQVKGMLSPVRYSNVHGLVDAISLEDVIEIITKKTKEEVDMSKEELEKLLSEREKKVKEEMTVSFKKQIDGMIVSFKEPTGGLKKEEMDAFLKEQIEGIKKEYKTLKESFEKKEKKLSGDQLEAHKASIKAKVDRLIEEGKVIPAWRDAGLDTFLESLNPEDVIKFSEKEEIDQASWLLKFLGETMPQVVNLKEITKEKEGHEHTKVRMFKVGDENKRLPIKNDELSEKAIQFMDSHNKDGKNKMTFKDALMEVSAEEEK